jgi:hypothetical protein
VKRRTASRLAWRTCALTLVLVFSTVVLTVLNHRGFVNVSFSIVGVSSAVVGAVPLPYAAAWFSNAIELFGPVLIFILIPLYFPTGRLVSQRWGIVAWLALGVLPVVTLLTPFSPGDAVNGTGIQNPVGVE